MSSVATILSHHNMPEMLSPEMTIRAAVAIFHDKHVRSAIVSRNGEHIDGLLTERDIVRGLDEFGDRLLGKAVSEIMSPHVVTCGLDASLAGLMAQMYDLNIRSIPVINKDRLLGMITMRDLIKARLDHVQADADAMRSYISNGA